MFPSHQPDPDTPPPPVVIDGAGNNGRGSAHIRIDIAGMASAILMVRSFRRMQARLKREGRVGDAAEIDRILTEWECRK